jgi:DMSO/TMAO reductase YedYZ molybdopterin-dependent catalytic subunit
MNAEPLPIQLGYPVRIVVPGWCAVASVIWLTAIEHIDRPFAGRYEANKYWYERERAGQTVGEPVTL